MVRRSRTNIEWRVIKMKSQKIGMSSEQKVSKNNEILNEQPEKSKSRRYAERSLDASTMSALLTDVFTKPTLPSADFKDVVDALSEVISVIQHGDMNHIEAMLIGQAQALQTMFVILSREAIGSSQMSHITAYMSMALKAQNQSKSTIQVLIELKYPKQATFVKQANISSGHQQVNNAINTSESTRGKKIRKSPNELMEVKENEWMDKREKVAPSPINTPVETMGK